MKLTALVASTTGAAWQWKRIKRKTDKDDALKLARLASIGGIESVPVPPRAIRQWKSLIGLRKRLVSERVRCQNRIRGVLVCQGLPAPLGAKAWTVLGLAGIGQFAQQPTTQILLRRRSTRQNPLRPHLRFRRNRGRRRARRACFFRGA